MNLAKLKMPDTVEVSGVLFPIHTGHPWWFGFFRNIRDKEAKITDFDYMYIGDPPEDRKAGFKALLEFGSPKNLLPRTEGDEAGPRLLDYDIDSDLIWAAVMQCYGVDLFQEEIHWHKVRAMLSSIHGTRLEEIMGYRCYNGKDVHLQKLRRMWELPEIQEEDDKKNLDEFNELLKE